MPKRASLSESGIASMFEKPSATTATADVGLTEKETLYLTPEARDCLEDLHRDLRRGSKDRPALPRSVASKSRIVDALLLLYRDSADDVARQILGAPEP